MTQGNPSELIPTTTKRLHPTRDLLLPRLLSGRVNFKEN